MAEDPFMPTPNDTAPELLTAEEVAALLRISLRTFNRHQLRGEGPQCKRVGRQRRWLRTTVVSWLEATDPDPQPSEKEATGRRAIG